MRSFLPALSLHGPRNRAKTMRGTWNSDRVEVFRYFQNTCFIKSEYMSTLAVIFCTCFCSSEKLPFERFSHTWLFICIGFQLILRLNFGRLCLQPRCHGLSLDFQMLSNYYNLIGKGVVIWFRNSFEIQTQNIFQPHWRRWFRYWKSSSPLCSFSRFEDWTSEPKQLLQTHIL